MGYDFDAPFTWNEEEDKKLLGSLFPQGIQSLENIRSNRLSPSDSPFGANSIFADPCDGNCEHKADFTSPIDDGMNLVLLAKDLNPMPEASLEVLPLEKNKFNYQRYLTQRYKVLPRIGDLDPVKIGANKEIEYTDALGNLKFTKTDVLLNKVECCVNTIPHLNYLVSPTNCYYCLFYIYKGTEENIHSFTGTLLELKEGKKYIAIELLFRNADNMITFLKASNRELFSNDFINKITNKFLEELGKAEGEPEKINSLYEKIPGFVVKKIAGMPGGEGKLFDHLSILLDYDDKGRWSNFRDSSNAVINLMRGFADPRSLFQKLFDDPSLIKRIYDDMDGSSVEDKIGMPNRSIFCSFLKSLCDVNTDSLNYTGKVFFYGNGHKLDSNIDERHDKYPGKIFLLQKKSGDPIPPDTKGDMQNYWPKPFIPAKLQEEEPPVTSVQNDDDYYFHPLDIVILVDAKTGFPHFVPAIFVKDLSDEAEQAEINRRLRIGIDILIAVFSLVVLKSGIGSSLFRASLAVDAGAALTDALITGYEEELNQTKEGREFLTAWNNIYTGYATITGLAAVRLVFNTG
ncbi:MAG TPA: hypothetical protein VF476_02355, partial [Chitinophagaceae bacterium]